MKLPRRLKTCVNCGKAFEIPPWKSNCTGRGTFCSRECKLIYANKHESRFKEIKNCLTCGKSFISYTHGLEKYCTKACYEQSRLGRSRSFKEEVAKVCTGCGKVFKTKRHSQVYCTGKCYLSKVSTKQLIKCPTCGKKVLLPAWRRKRRTSFCSSKCANVAHGFTKLSKKEQNRRRQFSHLNALDRIEKLGGKQAFVDKMHANWVPHYKDTSIELLLQGELKKRGISFETQKQIKLNDYYTYADIFIEPNICIYADGDYWHRKIKRVIAHDKYVNLVLPKLGYKVYRFWEKDIRKNPITCLSSIKEINLVS